MNHIEATSSDSSKRTRKRMCVNQPGGHTGDQILLLPLHLLSLLGVVAHTFNPYTRKQRQVISGNSRPAKSTNQVPGAKVVLENK